jgi:hypothetical protein
MQLLTQHIGCYECQSAIGYAEAALAICVVIVPDGCIVRDFCTSIDNGTTKVAIATDRYVRKNNALVDSAVRLHHRA